LAIGVGMIPRGEVGLVFAGVGSASGALSKPLEAAIIVMVILTTFLAPPFLRVVFPANPLDEKTSSLTALDDPATETLGKRESRLIIFLGNKPWSIASA
jgi:hypothetical protein